MRVTLWKRLKNLWHLSEYEPARLGEQYLQAGTELSTLVKRPKEPAKIVNPVDILDRIEL